MCRYKWPIHNLLFRFSKSYAITRIFLCFFSRKHVFVIIIEGSDWPLSLWGSESSNRSRISERQIEWNHQVFFLCCDRSYNRQFSIYSLSFLFLWKNYTMCHCLSLINTPNGFFTKSGVSKRSDCSLIDVFEKKINQHGIRTWFKTINRTFNKWFFFSCSLSYWTIVFVFVFDWIGWGISIFLFFFLVTESIPIDW